MDDLCVFDVGVMVFLYFVVLVVIGWIVVGLVVFDLIDLMMCCLLVVGCYWFVDIDVWVILLVMQVFFGGKVIIGFDVFC